MQHILETWRYIIYIFFSNFADMKWKLADVEDSTSAILADAHDVALIPEILLGGLLTHCGLVTPYSDIDLGQHSLRLWLDAVRQQAITWANVSQSSLPILAVHFQSMNLGY